MRVTSQQLTVNNQYSLLNTHFSTLNTQYSTVNTQWTGAGGRGWAASLVKDTDTLGDIFWNLFQSNLQCQVQVRQLCRTTRHKMFFLQNNDGVFSCIRTEYGLASKQILQSVSWYYPGPLLLVPSIQIPQITDLDMMETPRLA